jgi:hypothetical protein
MVSDTASFLLPDKAASLWRGHQRIACAGAWVLYTFALIFALLASNGFASFNIADVTKQRAQQETQEMRDLRRQIADYSKTIDGLNKSIDAECVRRGPKCADLESQRATVTTNRDAATAALNSAWQAVSAGADPQVVSAAKLIAWASARLIKPSTEDVAMLRLLLLTLLPQMGGLVLMVARR